MGGHKAEALSLTGFLTLWFWIGGGPYIFKLERQRDSTLAGTRSAPAHTDLSKGLVYSPAEGHDDNNTVVAQSGVGQREVDDEQRRSFAGEVRGPVSVPRTIGVQQHIQPSSLYMTTGTKDMVIIVTWEESVALATQVAGPGVVGRFVRVDRTVGLVFSPTTTVKVVSTAEQLDEERDQKSGGAFGQFGEVGDNGVSVRDTELRVPK